MKLIPDLLAAQDRWSQVRRDLHTYPELGFAEHRTANAVAEALQASGIAVDRGLGGTGVVGLVHGRDGGACGRMVGLRADMDALPLQERNTFAHASRHAGTMHACGHDGHTAMLLAAGDQLARQRDFDGTVVLIFQPAEEGGGGGRRMVEDGLFTRYPVEAVFGLHNWPGMAVGEFAAGAGPVMASSNEFRIVLTGKGGHAALPHLTLDPMPAACQLVLALQSVVSRNVKPVDAAVLSVTMVHAGEASNIIPDSVELEGTVRTFRNEVLDLVEQRMQTLATHMAAAHGLTLDFQFVRNYPTTINSAPEAAFCRSVLEELVGEARVLTQEPTMGAEDFAYMLQARPGCYAFIGNGDGDHRAIGHGGGPCTLHNPSYDFNDALIPIGASYWVNLAHAWLAQPRASQARQA